MNYLTSKEVKWRGFDKFRKECGTNDYVSFLQVSGVTHYMLSENKALGYIGLVVIEGDKNVNSVFFQNEDEIATLKNDFSFDWDMSPKEKADILHEYLTYD